jgi:hypothetical protein
MTDRDCQVLKKAVCEACQTLSKTITCEFHSASTMTVHRELRGMEFRGRAAAHKPNIWPVNAKRCLKWCEERHHWTMDDGQLKTYDLG